MVKILEFNLGNRNEVILRETITNNEFKAIESDKGTYILNNKYFNIINYLKEFNDENVLYYLIYPNGINVSDMTEIIDGNKEIDSDDGFMNKKTIYKLKG